MAAVNNGTVANLQSLVNSVSNTLAQNGVNPQAALNAAAAPGGAAAPGAAGAATPAAAGAAPAAGAQAPTGGIVTGGGATTTVGNFTTQSGKAVSITQTDKKFTMTPATGAQEIVNIQGKLIRFDATGQQTTAFAQVLNQRYHVDLDRTSGISNGLANLSKIFGASQQQVRDMSDALAEDASVSGTFDPVDLQQLSMAQNTSQQMTAIEKSIYDSMKESIQAWLQR